MRGGHSTRGGVHQRRRRMQACEAVSMRGGVHERRCGSQGEHAHLATHALALALRRRLTLPCDSPTDWLTFSLRPTLSSQPTLFPCDPPSPYDPRSPCNPLSLLVTKPEWLMLSLRPRYGDWSHSFSCVADARFIFIRLPPALDPGPGPGLGSPPTRELAVCELEVCVFTVCVCARTC